MVSLQSFLFLDVQRLELLPFLSAAMTRPLTMFSSLFEAQIRDERSCARSHLRAF
ncbi:hypothetical protein ACTUVN_000157 [Pseudomonas caspiana]